MSVRGVHRDWPIGSPLAFVRRARPRPYPPAVETLFVLTAAYMAVPYGDLPGLGLSLSSALIFLIGLEVFLRPAEPWLRRYRRWFLWGAAIWLGVFFSATLNGLRSGGVDFDLQSAKDVMYYGYWLLLVFPVTVYLTSRLELGRRVVRALAAAVVLAGLLRWFEALAWGKVGAWTSPRFFTQNTYGILFSTFAPALLAVLADPRTKRRLPAALGTLAVWSAAAVNGSRGSWVGLAVGTGLFILLYLQAAPSKPRGLIWVALLCLGFGLALQAAPERVLSAVGQRYATLQRLQDDKTFTMRQALTQKGLYLFRQSPLIGIGIGRWQDEYVAIELPALLGDDLDALNRKSSHNSYVSFLAEEGLLGAVPYAALLAFLALRGLAAALRLAHEGQVWALGAYAAFAAMSVHMWGLAGLTATSTWMVYGLVAAIIEAAGRRPRATSGMAV